MFLNIGAIQGGHALSAKNTNVMVEQIIGLLQLVLALSREAGW